MYSRTHSVCHPSSPYVSHSATFSAAEALREGHETARARPGEQSALLGAGQSGALAEGPGKAVPTAYNAKRYKRA